MTMISSGLKGLGFCFDCSDFQVTTREFLLADKSMHVLPVSMSLLLSWFSAVAFLADPVEVYYYGGIYCFLGVGYLLGILPAYLYFAARIHQMNITSCYEVSTRQPGVRGPTH